MASGTTHQHSVARRRLLRAIVPSARVAAILIATDLALHCGGAPPWVHLGVGAVIHLAEYLQHGSP